MRLEARLALYTSALRSQNHVDYFKSVYIYRIFLVDIPVASIKGALRS